MKLQGISVGSPSRDNLTLAQFRESELAQTPLGKLLIDLCTESVWSGDFSVSGGFWMTRSYLQIAHPAFLPSQSLIIHEATPLREVEQAIHSHLRTAKEYLHSVSTILQGHEAALTRASDKITLDKAKAAIVAAFPEAADASHFRTDDPFHAFMRGNDINRGCTYVVREVDGAFTGGVVRINRPAFDWYNKRDGLQSVNARAATFFGQLALSYAAKQLEIPEDELRVMSVIGVERPMDEWFNKPGIERFAVSAATLERANVSVPCAIAVRLRGNIPCGAVET